MTRLPGDRGVLVRLLADRSETLRTVQRALLERVRRELFGRSADVPVKP